MVRAVLRLTLLLAFFAPGGANYYGDPQSDAQWVPNQMEVEHACLRPPCGQGWVAEPEEAIVCPVPHTSPVWFSGKVDWEQVGADLFFGALVGGDGMPTKTKTWKSANGKISKANIGAGRTFGPVQILHESENLRISHSSPIETLRSRPPLVESLPKTVSRLESHIRISVKHRTQELIVSGAVRKALYHQRTASCDHAAADP